MADKENFRLDQELKVSVVKRQLKFRKPARTSRNTIHFRDVWYLLLQDKYGTVGVGECAPIFGLSIETESDIQNAIRDLLKSNLSESPTASHLKISSLLMAFETAMLDLRNGGVRNIFQSEKTPIAINGLVWMNEKKQMLAEAFTKIEDGFKCIKLKIGGIHFADELDILNQLRTKFSPSEIEIRLDANGAFNEEDVFEKLDALSNFIIHSIEQPIKQGNTKLMRSVIRNSPIPIALDEELIGINNSHDKEKLLAELQPHYIILKPSLHGGFNGCNEWIALAEKQKIKWWATSALESNIGLNAIAQWVLTKNNDLPHGLGTGGLFENNVPSPIHIAKGHLLFSNDKQWNIDGIISTIKTNPI